VLSTTQFWALMARWAVPDAMALALIGHPGKAGPAGRRPRFRLSTRQQRMTSYLIEIDAALRATGRDPAWLHRASRATPFGGGSPLALMLRSGTDGMAVVHRTLNRMAMRAAVSA
jgi:hypothetical protein